MTMSHAEISINQHDQGKMALSFSLQRVKPLVIVESPFFGATPAVAERNLRYARSALRDCILRGEVPLASHLLYTQPGVLNDNVAEERELGMSLGWHCTRLASFVAVYLDLGMSSGMQRGINAARELNLEIKERSLPDWRGTVIPMPVALGKNDPRFPPNH